MGYELENWVMDVVEIISLELMVVIEARKSTGKRIKNYEFLKKGLAANDKISFGEFFF